MYKSVLRVYGHEDEAEKVLIGIKDIVLEKGYNYEDYFFTRSENKSVTHFDVYLNTDCYHNIIDKLKSKNINFEVFENIVFDEVKDNFGQLGNYFLELFYKLSNKITLKYIENTFGDYSKKLQYILDLFIVSADFNYDSIKRGYFSYASHSKGFFTRWKDSSQIENIFYDKYIKAKDMIKERIITLTEARNIDKDLLNFVNSMKNLKVDVRKEFVNGNLKFLKQEDKNNPDLLYKSEFHNAIFENIAFYEYMNTNFDFLTSRLFTVFTYLVSKKIGLKNKDRYLLGYFIYKGVEDTFNLDCISTIKNFKIV